MTRIRFHIGAPCMRRNVEKIGEIRLSGIVAAVVLLVAGGGGVALAGSATWSATPGNSNWNDATNWSPTTIPNSSVDGASFNASSRQSISLSASTQVNGIYFGLAAPTYTITTSPG